MNFDLNINVQIGVTPQLATFLTTLLQSRPATETPALEVLAESEKPRHTRRAKADAPEAAAPAVAAEEVPEPEAQQTADEPKPFTEVPTQQLEKELTEEDIRAAMHRTRQRFEGEDYKDNTDSEAYKK